MNSLNTQFGGSTSNLQVGPSQDTTFGSNQGGNQGISEKATGPVAVPAHLGPASVEQKNAEEGKGQGWR